jgi:hypothetical protein
VRDVPSVKGSLDGLVTMVLPDRTVRANVTPLRRSRDFAGYIKERRRRS